MSKKVFTGDKWCRKTLQIPFVWVEDFQNSPTNQGGRSRISEMRHLEIWELGPLWESRFSGVVVTIFEKCQHVFGGLRRHVVFFSRKSPLNDGFLKIVENIYFLVKTLISWYVYKWWNFTKQILGGKRHSTPKRRSFWAAGGRQSIGSGTNLLSPSVDGSEIRRSPLEVGTRWASYQL